MSAKSLVCGDCGAQLKNMKAATEHAEVTGHSNFSESTEVHITKKCTQCGKPCDTKEEQELHTTRNPGHDQFEELASGELGAVGSGGSSEKKAPEISKELLQQLIEMGFPQIRAEKALVKCGGTTLEVALDWLGNHGEDIDIDEPWEVPPVAVVPKAPLTEEEKKAKAKELQAKLKANREAQLEEERKREHDMEKKRRDFGKQAQDILEEQRKAEIRNEEFLRRKAKEEELAAKARVQEELRKDRLERGFGTKDDEAARKAAEEKKRILELRSEFKAVFLELKAAHEDKAKVAAETLCVYLNNIIKNPTEEKYRKIKLANAAFQSRVGSLTGGLKFLHTCKFQESGEFLVVTDPDLIRIQAAVTELQVQLLYL